MKTITSPTFWATFILVSVAIQVARIKAIRFWLWAERRAISAVAWCRWMQDAPRRRQERQAFLEEQRMLLKPTMEYINKQLLKHWTHEKESK